MSDTGTSSTASQVRRSDVIGEIVRDSAAAMAAFDRDMRYLAASPSWLELYGRGRATLTGLSHYELWPELPERWKDVHRRGLSGEHVRWSEDSFDLPDGTLGWLDWSVSPWRDDDGAVGGITMTAVDITERKRAEAALRESEARYHALVDASPDGILVHVDRRVAYANAAAASLLGARDASELVGRTIYDLIAPAQHPAARERQEAHARNEPVPALVVTLRPLSGPAREVEVTSIRTTFDGRPAVYGVLRDVSEARRHARERAEIEARFAGLADNVDVVFSFTDAARQRVVYVSPAFDRVFGLPREEAQADPSRWFALVHADDRDALRAGMARTDAHELDYRIHHPLRGEVRWIHVRTWPIHDEHGALLHVATVSEDVTDRKRAEAALRESEERYHTLIDHSPDAILVHVGLRLVYVNKASETLLGAPASELVGRHVSEVLAPQHHEDAARRKAAFERGEPIPRFVVTTRPVTGEPREVEVSAIRSVFDGQPAVLAVARDLTEERRLARERDETDARFAALGDNIPEAFSFTDPERQRILYISPGFERVYGLSRAEVLEDPRRWLALVHHDDRDAISAGMASRDEHEITFRIVHPRDGNLRWIRLRTWPIHDARGAVVSVGTVSEDVTARRRAEEELRESEERYRALVEGSPDVIFVHVGLRIVYVNKASETLFGAPAADLVGRPISELLAPEHHEDMARRKAAFDRGEPIPRFVVTTRPVTGEPRDLEVTAIRTTFAGQVAIQAVARDVTEERRLARARAETEARFSELAANIEQVFAVFDADARDILYLSPAFEPVFGISREEVLADRTKWTALVHPDDRVSLREPGARIRAYDREYRIVRPDGALRWVRVHVRPVTDEHDTVLRVAAVIEDVTDRKTADLALRESEERYRRLVEASPDAIFVHQERRIVYANAASLRLFGASEPSQLLGRPVWEVLDPSIHARVAPRLEALDRSEGVTPRFPIKTRTLAGEVRDVEVSATTTVFQGQRAIQTMMRDVTEERRLERERAETEARFGELAANIDQVFTLLSADGSQILYLSPAFESVFGLSREAVIADRSRWAALVHPDDRPTKRAEGLTYPLDHEYRIVRPDGGLRWLRARVRPIVGEHGDVLRIAGVIEDITDRKTADLALRESEERYRRLVDASPYAIFVHAQRRIVFGNTAAARLFGLASASDLPGRMLWDVLHPSVREQADARLRRLERGEPLGTQLLTKVRTADGEAREVEVSPTLISLAGEPAILTMMRDVTEERRNAVSARDSAARLEGIVSSAMDAIVSADESLTIVLANPAAEQLFGYAPGELLGKRIDVLIPARLRVRHAEAMRRFAAAADGHRQMNGGVLTGVHRDGTEIPLDASIAKTELDGHTLFTVMHRDLRPRLAVEAAARESEERFVELAENTDVVFAVVSADRGQVLYLSPAFERVFGIPRAELFARAARWLDLVHPDDRAELQRRRQAEAYEVEYRIVRPDGAVRWLNGRVRPVRDPQGRVTRVVSVIADVTERRALEAQLQQSQKLDSIGRLAGGVAHDFNNLLTVITSSAELLHGEPLTEEGQAMLGEVEDAGKRGAALTRQLLTFSRQDIVEPRVLDLGEVVEDALRLLRRLIGENIRLTHEKREVARVRVDPGQWDQVLVNLVVNARDAMPKGGVLRVETGRIVLAEGDGRFAAAPPGRYALLRVSDAGEGMTPEVRARIFEPFFTTKPRQQGTGLGLAVVHGIVTQASGHIHVDSEVGRGTTISIVVPLTEETTAKPTTASGRQRALAGGSEVILLVEDDDAVRRVTSRSLAQRGYQVLTAVDGEAALRVLAEREVDLVLTDVVMPNLDGPSLVQVVRERWPAIKVLLSTGYADGSLDSRVLQEHPLLRKPYTQQGLLEKVREVLRG